MIRTLLHGAGRMARSVLALAGEYPKLNIVAQVGREEPAPDQAVPGVPFFPSLDAAAEALDGRFELVIDFTLPQGTHAAAEWCAGRHVALMSGVTGIDDETQAALDRAAESAPVLWAANLSFGINLMAGLLHDIGKVVDAAAPVRIEETHHAGKKDAPSGTALFLARHLRPPAGEGAGTNPNRIAQEFPAVEFVSRREGEVVGDHAVTISLRDETLTLAHHAEDRRLFARGALEAGQWLAMQPPGRYSAADWIRSVASGEPRAAS